MSDSPGPAPEEARLPDGSYANPVVAALLEANRDGPRYEAALAVASGREMAAARRLIRLELGAVQAGQDQRQARMAELRRRYPGIEDEAD
jgi:hypothetical protein